MARPRKNAAKVQGSLLAPDEVARGGTAVSPAGRVEVGEIGECTFCLKRKNRGFFFTIPSIYWP